MTVLIAAPDRENIADTGRLFPGIWKIVENLLEERVSTARIDEEVEKYIRDNGGEPAFKGYRGYPSTICASVNEVVVHGIPTSDVVPGEGDIVGVDVGIKRHGFFTDAARTFPVGHVGSVAERLLEITKKALAAGIEKAVEGNRLGDISNAVQEAVGDSGFEEVRAFVGHGIGRDLHEPPEVPNWGEGGKGPLLKDGLLLAIEPMINQGTRDVKVLDDGWTAVTLDGGLSAHFEHTVMVGKEKAEIIA